MPDKELADFIKGRDPAPEGRSCPYCSGDLLPRAQKCKYCGGWVVSSRNADTSDWSSAEATPGQLLLLKRLGLKVARGLTRADAAAELATRRASDPAAFAKLSGAGHRVGKKQRFPIVGTVFLLLVVVAVAGVAFHLSGRSAPMLEKIHAEKWLTLGRRALPGTPNAPAPPGAAASTAASGGISARTGSSGSAIPTPTASASDVGVPEDPEYAAIARTFTPVKPGQALSVSVRGGTEVAGHLKRTTPDTVVILRPAGEGHAEVTLRRTDLAAWSRALLYESDYVAYVMARRELNVAADAQTDDLARRTADYKAAFTAVQRQRREVELARRRRLEEQRRRGSRETPEEEKALKSGDMSIREWMEQNGASDALRARQERVRQFEAANPGM